DIVNNAYWFVTPRNGTEPDDPGGEDQEIIHPRIYSVTYHANGATSGIVPFDNNSPYVANDTVTVLGNTGNLARTGFSFAGWAFYDYAIAPYFAVAGATITPPDFIITGNTNLYAVWRIAVDTGQIAKTADQYGYVTDRSDGVINYQITYQLPDAAGIATWESLRLTDTYPANQLSFTGATVAYGTGAATSIQPDSTPNGVASFSFQASALSAYASQRITLTLTFEVAPGTTGTIANTGAYYITPVDGGDPGDPGSDDEEVFQVIPVLDFAKTYSAPFTAIGDTINFEVSFTLPNDLRGYGGLLLVDRLPSTLDYVSGYVLVNGIPAPGLAPVQSGNLLSSYFSRATLSVLGLEGATITMMLTTRVNNSWVSGDITNRAEIYYQTNKVGQPNPATDTPDEVVEVTVPYQPITYTVTYDANQGMNAPTDPNSPYIDGDTVTVLGPGEMIRSDSYYFRGWAYLSTATEPDFYYNTALGTLSPATFIIHADTTLYAVWAQAVIAYAPIPDFFSVTYAPGEHGTFDEQVTLGLVLNDETPLAPIPTGEEGWAFVGWSPEPSESVQGNAVYTALWEEAVVTVTFVDDDSNTVIKAESVPYGASATAPVTPPTKIGYEFAGWDTAFANVTEDIVVTASYKQVGATAEQATAAAAGNLTALYLSLIAAAVALSGFVGIRVFLSRKRQATSA
ncbi:MAG: InlB B-repeat-containing protein, partial [Coriobacteriia bacterium]|nr:InlB B-repeat-containing protein [Coriobacteriia bacterium]